MRQFFKNFSDKDKRQLYIFEFISWVLSHPIIGLVFLALLITSIMVSTRTQIIQAASPDQNRLEIHANKIVQIEQNYTKNIIALCDTGNGNMLYIIGDYRSVGITVVSNGCHKK